MSTGARPDGERRPLDRREAGAEQDPMTDTATTSTDTTDAGATAPEQTTTTTTTAKSFTQDEVNALVKDRLARERAKLGDVEELRKKASEFDRLSEAQKTELEKATEKAAKQARDEASAEVDAKWKDRVLRSEVKVAAAGKLADPEDALRLLDLSGFELDDDGNADEQAIAKAIDELLEQKPYLAATGTAPARQKRDTFDAGTRTTGSSSMALNGDPLLDSVKAKLGIT